MANLNIQILRTVASIGVVAVLLVDFFLSMQSHAGLAVGVVMLFLMLVFAVTWNFATAALLAVAWSEEAGLWSSIRAGVSASLANLRKWWLVLVAQMFPPGLVIFYCRHGSDGAGTHTNVNSSVNAFRTGGYEDDCRWHGTLADALRRPKRPTSP